MTILTMVLMGALKHPKYQLYQLTDGMPHFRVQYPEMSDGRQ